MPVHPADEFETRDFLICQVSDNLQHFSTVAIETEDFQVEETGSVHTVLKEQGASSDATDKPLSVLCVLQKMSLHLNFILINKAII